MTTSNVVPLSRDAAISLALEQINTALESTEAALDRSHDAMLGAQTRNESRFDTYREEYSQQLAVWRARTRDLEVARDLIKGLLGIEASGQGDVGSIVVAARDGGEQTTYVMLESHSMRAEIGGQKVVFVSRQTPIFQALLGKGEGDTVTVRTRQPYELHILSVY